MIYLSKIYHRSLSVSENLYSIISYIAEKDSELLLNFVTFDSKFILKAVSKREQRVFLREKLEEYYDRVIDSSFIQHIYGCFKVNVKGQYYRLNLCENNPIGCVIRESISVSSTSGIVEVEENLEDKFYIDLDLKEDFRNTLDKDLEYLARAGIYSCKIFIDILNQVPDGNRKVYSGIYRSTRAYLSVRIFDIVYTRFHEKSKNVRSSGIEMFVTKSTMSRIESIINAYIN
jgi:hypothetical protein